MDDVGYSLISRQEASRTIVDVTRAHPNIQSVIATISSRIDPVKTAAAFSMALVAHPTAFGSDTVVDGHQDKPPGSCVRGTASDDVDGEHDKNGDKGSNSAEPVPHRGTANGVDCVGVASHDQIPVGRLRRREERALAAAVPLRIAIDTCVPCASTLLIQVAATKIHKRVPGAVRTWQSAQRTDVVTDFGVYKRDGFDEALARVRGLPGMSDADARQVAQRGASRASNHPRDMYNPRFVDVVPRSESGAREGLIATHRGIDEALTPDGLWVRLSVEIGEEDAGAHGAAIVGVLSALARSSEPGRVKVPSPRDLDWIPLYAS